MENIKGLITSSSESRILTSFGLMALDHEPRRDRRQLDGNDLQTSHETLMKSARSSGFVFPFY